jgi:alkylhydroperoxidase family enzyme
MSEDEIAALDGDWIQFTPAERAAFAFARRITLEPNLLGDADIDNLRPNFSDLQILEMIMSVAGNNAINRWKEGVGVPQSQGGGNFGRRRGETSPAAADATPTHHSYLTPTSEEFQHKLSLVAPLFIDSLTGIPTRKTVFSRPKLESREDVERALAACRSRQPRLPLATLDETRSVIGEIAHETPPQYMRLLANFPEAGKRMATTFYNAEIKGDLTPLLKAQAAWIIARQDRAWYALAQARHRLHELGQTDDQIFALDGDWSDFPAKSRSLFTVARKLAASPVVLTDDDVTQAVELTSPRDVVQLISYTTTRASFDRVTEAAGLSWKE